ncbi:MAG: hypothetical protein HN392_08955 [Anaerolineae bacterium]|jgi:vancomycin resistance protein YoaR|nr:hypothetical protein [Anaerolineae bacterium]MBT7073535.1 hypothetical protein [Anaerolineae bacterium]MBT7781957.1 hypothetical protein [Anaerolineae bacterium]
MKTTSYTRQAPERDILQQVFAALFGGIALFITLLIIWTLGYQLIYAGRIFPGISVAGIDLSGMSPADASITLTQRLAFPYQGQILMRDGEKIWATSPTQLGMVFDSSASARSAYELGRSGGLFGAFSDQLDARQQGKSADIVIIFDQQVAYSFLQQLALEINHPPVEASLDIQGTEVIAQPGQVGRYLNVDAALITLTSQLQTFRDAEVNLIVDEVHPQLIDVSSQADAARQILSTPLTLNLPAAGGLDAGPWTFDIPAVAEMLIVQKTISDASSKLDIMLATSILSETLLEIATEIDRPSENARFVFNDETRQLDILRPSITGRTLDIQSSVAYINENILTGTHNIDLQVALEEPAVSDRMTAAELGITELVNAQTSYFYGSSPERIQNIQAGAAPFHGVLIAPGETFSMGSILGDISLDNGFAEALIIFGGKTIKGVGGGICQVSTTLFRNAFFAGFPIVERHSHAYRVSYYEQNSFGERVDDLVGLDATVYFPLVDFQFENDTPYWLLMETYLDIGGRNLTWKFYSTSDGRTVDWTTTGTENIISSPAPLFEESDELAKNEIKQVDWSADGADVSVSRTVLRNGSFFFEDVFNTHYEPWQAICQYGIDTNNPEKKASEQGLCN